MLKNLRSQRDDLHEVLRAQFAGNRAEDARSARVVRRIDDDDRVAIKAQVAAVGTADRSLRADDNRFRDLTLFHGGFGRTLLDVDGDDIADASSGGDLAFTADHGGFPGTGIVGDVEN